MDSESPKESGFDDLSDLAGKAMRPLESLMRNIPGFDGYLQRSDRRQADQLIRETIAARFEAVRRDFAGVHETLSADIIKAIDFAEPLGRIDNGLMGLIGKIKDAPQGYSSFFDTHSIDAEKLDEIYGFDESMMGLGEQINTDVQSLHAAVQDDAGIQEAIKTLSESVKLANSTFASRSEVLTSMTD